MLRYSFVILGLFMSCLLSAQVPEGTWVMSYVRAKQPIFTMVDNEGSFELADEVPQDSTYLFSPGLMTLQFGEEINSYSWEGKESWEQEVLGDSLFLYGKRDTLYGVYHAQKIILSSTLDDRPTEYHFDPLDIDPKETPDLMGYRWKAKVEQHSFDDALFRFSLSPNSDPYTVKPIDLGPMKAFEYELPPTQPEANDQEYGIVYLFKTKRKRLGAIFYPARDDSSAPLRKEMSLKRK